jgi:hypothetical protein
MNGSFEKTDFSHRIFPVGILSFLQEFCALRAIFQWTSGKEFAMI